MDKNISKTQLMEKENILRLIFKFSFTSFCALFFDALYNIVDTLFVSHGVGDNAMGGVSILFPFMLIQSAISQMAGGGAASIVSRLLGKKEYEKAGNATANAMALFYISAVIVSIIGFVFMSPILHILGATDDILPYAKQYFTVMLIGNVFSTGFSSIIRAEGKMTYALLIWLIPTCINILLDAVFIYGFDMGVTGAALATVLCYFSSFCMMIIFFTKLSCQKFRKIRIKIKTVIDIITMGIPTLLQIGSMSVIFLIINRLISMTGGTNGINTFAYLSKIITFAIVPITAVSQAVSPVISYNFGADHHKRVKAAFKCSVLICEIYATAAMITALCVPRLLMKVFTADEAIAATGALALRILSAALPFAPVTMIVGSYFQAIGRRIPSITAYGSIMIFLIISIFILSEQCGLNGIWLSVPSACILSALSAVIIYLATNKQSKPNRQKQWKLR